MSFPEPLPDYFFRNELLIASRRRTVALPPSFQHWHFLTRYLEIVRRLKAANDLLTGAHAA